MSSPSSASSPAPPASSSAPPAAAPVDHEPLPSAKLNPAATARFPNTQWIDKVKPQPHRCSAHLDDLIAAVQTLPLEVRGPWKAFWQCNRTNSEDPLPPRYQRTQPITYEPIKPASNADPFAFLHTEDQTAEIEKMREEQMRRAREKFSQEQAAKQAKSTKSSNAQD